MVFKETAATLASEHFFSQAELARRSGVHALTITRLETGRPAPSMRTVCALAEALGVQAGELAIPRRLPKPIGASSKTDI